MPHDKYHRPTDEFWLGEGGKEPMQVPNVRQRPSRFGRPSDERWWGPSEDETPAPGLSYSVDLFNIDGADSQTVYMKEGNGAVCYYANTSVGALTFSGTGGGTANPPDCSSGGTSHITGNFTKQRTFTAWWNEANTCNFPPAADFTTFRVSAGPVPIMVVVGAAITRIAAFGTQDFTGVADAGYGTGDQSAYASGTVYFIRAQ